MRWRNGVLIGLGAALFAVALATGTYAGAAPWVRVWFLLGAFTLLMGLWAWGDGRRRAWRHWLTALLGVYVAAVTVGASESARWRGWTALALSLAIASVAAWEASSRGRRGRS